ncbi:MAG: nuclear transport factor 2 family protein [Gemmatimonadaceae bacterium]|nr:nuclear transport factor 2 family protein [Gemmatimonadaceae bacterium]
MIAPFLLFLLAAAPPPAQPPATAADSALAVVQQLFDGMRAGDSSVVRRAFHPSASLFTAAVRNGASVVQQTTIDAFARSVGSPHPEVLDERLYQPVVHVDGGLASIWVEYSFFLGKTFSHCGIDAFHLARTGSEWKIISIVDTRRREGCRTTP